MKHAFKQAYRPYYDYGFYMYITYRMYKTNAHKWYQKNHPEWSCTLYFLRTSICGNRKRIFQGRRHWFNSCHRLWCWQSYDRTHKRRCRYWFYGVWASVYIYTGGSSDYAVNFAQLTQRAGNFLVSRDNISNFKWSDVKGKTIIGGRAGRHAADASRIHFKEK